MQRRVLVTGASGFVGRYTLMPLSFARDVDVHAVCLEPHPGEPELTWHQADLLDESDRDALLRDIAPTHLLHAAWFTTHGEVYESPHNDTWAEASNALFTRFHELGGQRAVLVGSCAQYDWTHDTLSETDTPTVSASRYGRAKQLTEDRLMALAKEGLSAACGRLFFVYGPYDTPKRLVPSVIAGLVRDEPVALTHGEQIRDYLYAEDAGAALAALLLSDVQGPVNIASGRPVRLKDIVEQLAGELDRKHLLKFGARPTPAGEPARLEATVNRLFNEVGWSPRHDLESGCRRTLAWWRSRV